MTSASRIQIVTYFTGVCFLSISLLVFMNAAASFVVTDIVGQRYEIGNAVGTLGFADELVAILACPLWGLLSDQTGPRLVVFLGYAIIAIALAFFVNARNVIPELLLMRMLFSIGASAVSTMVTAILPLIETNSEAVSPECNPLSYDNLNGSDPVVPTEPVHAPLLRGESTQPHLQTTKSFGIAGMVGTAAGCGALLAVFGFLRIPPSLQQYHLQPAETLRVTFYLVSIIAMIAAVVCYLGLRNIDKRSDRQTQSQGHKIDLPTAIKALRVVLRNDCILLAYLGGFVARASSVGISLFIPLWVNSHYIKSGQCQIDDPSQTKEVCAEAYKAASIWTGVSQLAALLLAPIWGFLSERYCLRRLPLLLTGICGMIGYLALCAVKDPTPASGSTAAAVIVTSILVGTGQIGAIVCSLGLLSTEIVGKPIHKSDGTPTNAINTRSPNGADDNSDSSPNNVIDEIMTNETDELRNRSESGIEELQRIGGLVAGLYSFSGGVGILMLTKIGGYAFDQFSNSAPFLMLAFFNMLLIVTSITCMWKSKI